MDKRKIISQIALIGVTTLISPLMPTANAMDKGPHSSQSTPEKSGGNAAKSKVNPPQAQAERPAPTRQHLPERTQTQAVSQAPTPPPETKTTATPPPKEIAPAAPNPVNTKVNPRQAQAERPAYTRRSRPKPNRTRAASLAPTPPPQAMAGTPPPQEASTAATATGNSFYLGGGISETKITFDNAYTTDYSIPDLSITLPSDSQTSRTQKTATTGNFKLGYQMDISRLTMSVETFAARGSMDMTAHPIRVERNRPDSTFKTRLNDLEGASVLAGVKLNSRFAVYGMSGVVRGHVQSSYQSILGNPQQFTDRSNLNGYIVGGGVEYRLTRHISVRAEYGQAILNPINIESDVQDSTAGPTLVSPLLTADPVAPNLTRAQKIKLRARAKTGGLSIYYHFGGGRGK